MKRIQMGFSGLVALLFCSVVLAENPPITEFRPGEVWRDESGVAINAHGGGILVYGNRYWWFGEHKTEGPLGNTAQVGVHCYSSSDLYNWQDEGIVLSVSDDPESEITRGAILERPKVLYNEKTKQFVMWFHLEIKASGYSSARSGIAVADRVTGPYRFVRSVRPNAGSWPWNVSDSERTPLTSEERTALAARKISTGYAPDYPANILFRRDFEEGQDARDMTLFQDDDGRAYHIYSSESNGVLHLAELTDDYLDYTGSYTRAMVGRFFEAPALFKKGNQYFLFASDCTGWAPNAARLAVANKIQGPWTELGNPCRGSEEQKSKTFNSQSTFILQIPGKEEWIFMADRWCPENPIDGRYVWLPVRFDEQGIPFLEWKDNWQYAEQETLNPNSDDRTAQ